MIANQTTNRVRDTLSELPDGDFSKTAEKLLGTLGYRGDDAIPSETVTVGDFIVDYPAANPDTRSEQEFVENTQSVRFISQVSDTEITANAQQALIDASAFDTGNARSFLFLAVELKEDTYSRGQYAAFTREINKRWQFPTVVLFKTAANLLTTLAFAHRRPHRRDPERDVLGNVFLIREIDPVKPHRAHLDILDDLSLPKRLEWMSAHGKPHNFDGLLDAWLDALDTEELNRRFYEDLFDWFERAVAQAKFPKTGSKVLKPEEHVIRLITRLLFVWFIKEKGLVAEDLFVENRVGTLLQDYDRADGDSYYRAVLQNLFFATLNTEIDRRGFSNGNKPIGADSTGDFSLYRYREEMTAPDAIQELLRHTPFINGGLFDCLDSEGENGDDDWRIDCFTDDVTDPGHSEYGILSIPNGLFFDEDNQNPGLITLFNRYKFTVEENTPAEQEVALDPELLGKVFENLLAANIPETSETVRKQTGSYYTPRPVVDYMVNEVLVGALAQKAQGDDGDGESWQAKLRDLLDYDDAFNDADDRFSPSEKAAVVRAIANIRTLDPAVGSGAFPMSILHQLTLALRRLDPNNHLWAELQKERALEESGTAYEAATQQERDERLAEISETFERYRDSDFGRKLYLIQNSIYGVDIQVIATQIAKLRFFISLAIEQQAVPTADNLGIKPLPNLETRFVAADSLIGLSRPTQLSLGQTDTVKRLQDELDNNREQHFHANTRRRKLEYRKHDAGLREQLAAALRETGFAAGDADKVAQWDPYDQNASSAWFDPEYMFGVSDGFDVVIANPPYVQLQKDGGRLRKLYQNAGYTTFTNTGDVYQLFQERGCRLLRPSSGLLAYITSNSWLKAEYGKASRRYFSEKHTPLRLLELGKDVFESAIVDSSVLLLREGRGGGAPPAIDAVDTDKLESHDFPPDSSLWGQVRPDGDAPWIIMSGVEQSVLGKMRGKGTPLKNWNVKINRGVTTGCNEAFIIDEATRTKLIAADPDSADIIKPVLRGRHIQRYRAEWDSEWLITTFPALKLDIDDYPAVKQHFLDFGKERLEQSGEILPDGSKARKKTKHSWFESQDSTAYYEDFAKGKLLWIELVEQGRFAYDESGMYCSNSAYMLSGISIKYLCAVLNATLTTWFMSNTALTSGMGATRWIRSFVETIPVPKLTAAKQRPFIRLVDRILKAKAADPDANTSEIEEEIDWLVYELYGLTNAEVAAVEGEKGEVHATVEEEDAALSRAMDEVLGEERVSRDELMAVLQAPDEG